MPIRRFRSIAEKSAAPPVVTSLSPWERLREVLALSARLCPVRRTPGVHKHRSIEEAAAQRAQDERARALARRP